MTPEKLAELHAKLMKAYRSDIYWLRQNVHPWIAKGKQAEFTEKRARAAKRHKDAMHEYYAARDQLLNQDKS